MTAHVEHFTHEIDFVQQEDGSWRADGYPYDGARPKTSRCNSYPSRIALLTAYLNTGVMSPQEFWRDVQKKGVEHNG